MPVSAKIDTVIWCINQNTITLPSQTLFPNITKTILHASWKTPCKTNCAKKCASCAILAATPNKTWPMPWKSPSPPFLKSKMAILNLPSNTFWVVQSFFVSHPQSLSRFRQRNFRHASGENRSPPAVARDVRHLRHIRGSARSTPSISAQISLRLPYDSKPTHHRTSRPMRRSRERPPATQPGNRPQGAGRRGGRTAPQNV
jgi:hypothetical protein